MQPSPYDAVRASDAVVARLRERHPNLIDLTTGRIERLLEDMGRPQDRLAPVVHIAGTNGKGSTAAFIRAMAEAAGLKVHALTSPHLVRFAERIRIAGALIDDQHMIELIERAEAANAGRPISFFELTTAIALTAFAEAPADLVVIEVGLGGRYDATNVFARPACCVIAPVDLDHLELLGPELSKIAWEKAGILREGVPAVIARQPEAAREVIGAEAEAVGARLICAGEDFDAWAENGRLLVQMEHRLLDLPPPALFGKHQYDNAGLAVAAILQLGDARIDEAAIGRGIASAVWPARFQRLNKGPLAEIAEQATLWLDGGHNPHAGRALAMAASELLDRDPRPLRLVVGMLDRKDARGFFEPFAGLAQQVATVGFSAPNATPPEQLANAACAAGLSAHAMADVEQAVKALSTGAGPPPHILICGGLHLAGDVLALSPETWPT